MRGGWFAALVIPAELLAGMPPLAPDVGAGSQTSEPDAFEIAAECMAGGEAVECEERPPAYRIHGFNRAGTKMVATWSPADSGAADCVDTYGVVVRLRDMATVHKVKLVDADDCFADEGREGPNAHARWLARLAKRGFDVPAKRLMVEHGTFGSKALARLDGELRGWYLWLRRSGETRLELVLVSPDNRKATVLGAQRLVTRTCRHDHGEGWACGLTEPHLLDVVPTPDGRRLVVEWTLSGQPCWSDMVGHRRVVSLPRELR